MSVLASTDRRSYERFPVQVQVKLIQSGSDVPIRLQTSDLSRGGCYVQLMTTMAVGTVLDITLWIEEFAVRIKGRVVTCHPQCGNGIQFTEFENKNGEELLQGYLYRLVGEARF